MALELGFNEVEIDALENKSVEAVWTYYKIEDKSHTVIPDGRADLILTFDILLGGKLSNIRPITCLPFTKALVMNIKAHQGFIGIRLRAGAADSFLNTPISHITDSLPSGEYALAHAPWLENLCRDKSSVNQLFTNINQHLSVKPTQTSSSMVTDILSLIHEAQGLTQVSTIAQQINVSERTINRQFSNAVGLSPKQFSSIIRLRRAMECLAVPNYAISSIAIDCGYSDQAHMTRELKNYMGQTPTRLQKAIDNQIII